MTGVFAQWQPVYADHGIATFPVNDNKVPAVRNYGRIGINASSSLASRFGSGALGFMCGCRSGITVLDVDTADERVLADAIDRHGKTPIVARSGSGHFQAWYRYGGERRLIRPRRDVPIDILGGGFVVAPPSRVLAPVGNFAAWAYLLKFLIGLFLIFVLTGADAVLIISRATFIFGFLILMCSSFNC